MEQLTRKLKQLALQYPRASLDSLLRLIIKDNTKKTMPRAIAAPAIVDTLITERPPPEKHFLLPRVERMDSIYELHKSFYPERREPVGIFKSLLRWISGPPAVKHRSLGRRICIVGVHGWFPTKVLQTVVGVPQGTSSRLCTMMSEVTREFIATQPLSFFEDPPRVDCVPLEGAGCINERVDRHYEQLNEVIPTDGIPMTGRSLIEHADTVIFVAHSQGAPVTALLADRMLTAGILRPSQQSVSMLTLAGVFHGPFPSLKENLVVKYVEADAARELFELNDPNGPLNERIHKALSGLLSKDVLFCCIASWLDQVVPVHSSTLLGVSHPHIWRAVYVDAHNYKPDFLSHYVQAMLSLVNAGVPEARELFAQLSGILAGSLYQSSAHSTLYSDHGVYDAMLRWIFAIPRKDNTIEPILHKNEMFPQVSDNPYILPWLMRGLLSDHRLWKLQVFAKDWAKLRELYPEWIPDRKVWQQLKLQLAPLNKI